MVNPGREPLSGLVEANETIMPFRTKNEPGVMPAGRSGVGKMLVTGARSKSTAVSPGGPDRSVYDRDVSSK